MNARKTVLSSAMALAMGGVSLSANAALTTTALLEFTPGVEGCLFGGTYPNNCAGDVTTVVSGSFFSMDTNGNGKHSATEKTAYKAGADGGIHIGVTQDATGSHGGGINGNETSGINIWEFFGNTGMDFTATPITVVTDNGTTKDLDMSGWRVAWNGIPSIDMGGGFQDCGNASDSVCLDTKFLGMDTNNAPIFETTDISGTYNNGNGTGTITCSNSSCSQSSTFSLHYEATVPWADTSGFGGVFYAVDMVGHVGTAVPVPAAAWLFGSGLIGLVGVARRKKA